MGLYTKALDTFRKTLEIEGPNLSILLPWSAMKVWNNMN